MQPNDQRPEDPRAKKPVPGGGRLSGPPDRLTLSDLAEGALRREVDRLKRVHMKGKTFAKRGQELKGGRPIR